MKTIYSSFLISGLFFSLFACSMRQQQSVNEQPIIQEKLIAPTPLASLPKSCDESSGLEYLDGQLLTINDSGADAEIDILNLKGKKEKTITLKDGRNIDWESLAANDNHLFIADFGNNLGTRKNLTIYQVERDFSQTSLKSKTIEFDYEDQKSFELLNRQHEFDAEALLAFNDELVLFSKDWKYNQTRVYHIPIQTKEKITISPTEKMDIQALITGADYNSKRKKLVLCGYLDYENYIWIFNDAAPDKLLTDSYTKIHLKGLKNAQVEGVTFKDNSTIIFSTEETKTFKQQLWTLSF